MHRHNSETEQNKNIKQSGKAKTGPHAEKPATPRKRACLSCGKSFASEGAHHRICDNCKTLQGWSGGNPSYARHRPHAANDNG